MGWLRLAWVSFLWTLSCVGIAAASEYQKLTNSSGAAIEAKVLAYDSGRSVDIELKDGRVLNGVLLDKFSKESIAYFDTWAAKLAASKNGAMLQPDSKIKVFVKSSRDNGLNEKGDPDNREVEYEPALTFDNEEKDLSFKNVMGTLVFIGESVLNKREMHILYREDFTVDLPAGERIRWEGKPFTNVYDDYARNGSAFGAEYEGYLLVLRDKKGDIAYIKASKSKWEDAYNLILKANMRKAHSSDFSESFDKTKV